MFWDFLNNANSITPELSAVCQAGENGAETTIGASLLCFDVDRTATLWPIGHRQERPLDERSRAIRELIRHAQARVANSTTWILQCMLPIDESLSAAELTTCGFRKITALDFMKLELNSIAESRSHSIERGRVEQMKGDQKLEVVGIDETTKRDLITAMSGSLVGTLDCPELEAGRGPEEAIRDYQAMVGDREHSLCLLGTDAEGPTSLSFWFPANDGKSWQLAYLGVMSTKRGRRWGRMHLEKGIDQLLERDCESVHLGVDTRNHYAIRLYENMGFEKFDRQLVYVWFPKRRESESSTGSAH